MTTTTDFHADEGFWEDGPPVLPAQAPQNISITMIHLQYSGQVTKPTVPRGEEPPTGTM